MTERRRDPNEQVLQDVSAALEAAKTNRVFAIRRAHEDGWTVRRIAERVGLSPARVHQIIHGV